MSQLEILFDKNGDAISPNEINIRINEFEDSYIDATKGIIENSRNLNKDGEVFIKCASHILSNFGMTRSGPFHGDYCEKLSNSWKAVGANLLKIHDLVCRSGIPRSRYILKLSVRERKKLTSEIWLITKKLLPFTMGKTSYGLVGASKILFSVLPEIVLPIDNTEWLQVFKTVDIGDVLQRMVLDIQSWKGITGMYLNDVDPSMRLTTLPSVYNVMAMAARPKTARSR